MKKIACTLLIALAGVALAGCGGGAPTGNTTRDEFDAATANLGVDPYRSGNATIATYQKQNGQEIPSRTGSGFYTYGKEDGNWSIATTSGDTSVVSSYQNVYNQRVVNYAEAVDTLVEKMDSYTLVFNINANSNDEKYNTKLVGKLDYTKLYPSIGATGLLDQTLEITWDQHGMLKKWYYNVEGNINYQHISYHLAERVEIAANWVE